MDRRQATYAANSRRKSWLQDSQGDAFSARVCSVEAHAPEALYLGSPGLSEVGKCNDANDRHPGKATMLKSPIRIVRPEEGQIEKKSTRRTAIIQIVFVTS